MIKNKISQIKKTLISRIENLSPWVGGWELGGVVAWLM